MIPEFKQALEECITAMADVQVLLGRRDGEWTGHAPSPAEEKALARIAGEELGHARLWYAWLAELRGLDPARYADQLMLTRPASARRATLLVDPPKGDWAFTVARQFVFDAWEAAWADLARASPLPRLAEIAAKIRVDELHHLRDTGALMAQLTHRQMRAGLEAVWPHTAELFAASELDSWLLDAKIIPSPAATRAAWLVLVGNVGNVFNVDNVDNVGRLIKPDQT